MFGLILVAALACERMDAAEKLAFRVETKDQGATLLENEKPLWIYNTKFQKNPRVPEKDPRCMAACYIHPLFGLEGEQLTDDAPRDHYHHHGVFWNWPHVQVHRENGSVENYDTWTGNTRLKQLFVKYGPIHVTEKSAQITVENGWFLAPKINEYTWDENGKPSSEKLVSEELTITTHPMQERDGLRSRAIDLDFTWTIGKDAISLQGAEGKSYGGLTIRFRPSTDKPGGDSIITVPSGVAEQDLPEAPLKWADYTSVFGRDEAGKPQGKQTGAAIFVAPDHPDYPPTWLTRYYGPLCLGWPGVKKQTFTPGEKIRLSYRIWIHDRKVSVEEIQTAYEEYCAQR